MSAPQTRLDAIPPDLLQRHNAPRLLAYCEAHGFRPTLLQIETLRKEASK